MSILYYILNTVQQCITEPERLLYNSPRGRRRLRYEGRTTSSRFFSVAEIRIIKPTAYLRGEVFPRMDDDDDDNDIIMYKNDDADRRRIL